MTALVVLAPASGEGYREDFTRRPCLASLIVLSHKAENRRATNGGH